MSEFEKGDRVIATEDLGGGFFGSNVPKGTEGVVTNVEDGMFSAPKFFVSFENGEREEVSAGQIAKA